MKYDEILTMIAKQKTRRKPRHLESAIQQACVSWFRQAYPRYLIIAVPNGGSRNAKEASNLKKEGVTPGVSDLIIIAERAVLFIEMKAGKNTQQQTQKDFQKTVERLGHIYKVCYSLQEFQLTVEYWLKERYGYDTSV